MSIRNKKGYSTKNRNGSLLSLSNEELQRLSIETFLGSDANTHFEAHDILKLRHNINILSRSSVFGGPLPGIEENDKSSIACCFSNSEFSSPQLMFLSKYVYDATSVKKNSTCPITLYIGLNDATRLEDIIKNWATIKYWRDYIHHAQRENTPVPGEDFLYDLHSQNMAGVGYGSLTKQVNERLERLLRLEESNEKWIKTFEKELRAYLSKILAPSKKKSGRAAGTKNPQATTKTSSDDLSDYMRGIRHNFRFIYGARNSEHKKRLLDIVYKAAPLKCLDSMPEKDPYLVSMPDAMAILAELGYTKKKREEWKKAAMQEIAEGRTMKKIVTASQMRETLRWWRDKYDYPSPGKTGLG
jgi:hypothetical protein